MYDIRILNDEIINFMKIFTERGYTIYNDDCIKVMHQLITQGVKVDAVICDPPYGKQYYIGITLYLLTKCGNVLRN